MARPQQKELQEIEKILLGLTQDSKVSRKILEKVKSYIDKEIGNQLNVKLSNELQERPGLKR